MKPPPEGAESRRLVYALLITVAVGMAVGRLLSAERVYEPSLHRPPTGASDVPLPAWPSTRPAPWPTFSSNDRSRWAAVRALVDEGTFVIGRRDREVTLASAPAALAARNPLELTVLLEAGFAARVRSDTGIIFEDGWQSVDKVLHPERLEFYSTKPPLLTVLAAGEYWVLKHAFGWSIADEKGRWKVIPAIVLTFNVVPLLLYLWLLSLLAEEWGTTDFGRYLVMGAGCFGTLVTPFLISFNNHTVATASTVVAVYATVRIVASGGGAGWYALAGLAAGFTACTELPAASLAAGLFVYLAWRSPVRALAFFAPAALLPVAALLGCNYAELGRWTPAYAETGSPWYQYEGSHWRVVEGVVKRGIDWAGRQGESKWAYAFHLLLGHHGVISLTPVTALGLAGAAWGALLCFQGPKRRYYSYDAACSYDTTWSHLAAFTLLVTVVVVGFYIARTDNYGGWSNGPRWLMWLTPLWLLSMLPVADALARSTRGRALGLVLLAISVMSMSYQAWTPWRHPWLYAFMESRGWIRY